MPEAAALHTAPFSSYLGLRDLNALHGLTLGRATARLQKFDTHFCDDRHAMVTGPLNWTR